MKSFKYSLIVTIVGVVLAGLLTLVTSLWLDARKQKAELSLKNSILISENECWVDELGKSHTRTYQYSIERERLLNSKDSAIKQNKILQNIALYYQTLPKKEQKKSKMAFGVSTETHSSISIPMPNKSTSDDKTFSLDLPTELFFDDGYFQGTVRINPDSSKLDYIYKDSLTGSFCTPYKEKWNWKRPFKKRAVYFKGDIMLSNPKAKLTGQEIIEIKK